MLSSRLTFTLKLGFPGVWSVGWGWGTLQTLLHPESALYNGVPGAAPSGFGIMMLGLWLVGTAGAAAFGWGLKRAALDGDALVFSNYVRRVRVPLTDVRAVRRSRFPHAGGVTVEFTHHTAFGNRARFIARGRPGGWQSVDALVDEILAHITQAQAQHVRRLECSALVS